MGSFSSVSAADGVNILNDLKVQGEIRPRYEFVNDSVHDNANAFTARTKLKVTGKLFNVDGLTASVGIISVNDFGSNTYNSTSNGETKYAVVADPEKAMISNAAINYKIDKTTIHAGRGQVNLDNQRFIGTVGWRQLERSYDSVFVANNSVKNLSVLAAWVYGVQGVKSLADNNGLYGENTYDTNTVLLHASYKVMPALTITAYDYMIASINDTYGIALTGKVKLDSVKLNYRAEYAMQSDATMEIHNAAGNADADYYNLDLGANISGILAGVNYEFLSGTTGTDGNTAFSCTLGTNHKFNGWADMFLATPKGGLIDANVRLGYKAKGFGKFLAVYHNFTADKNMATTTSTSDDLGSEFDAVYVNKIPGVNGLTGLLKYADYSKGSITGYNDTQKIWAQLDYKFSTK
jgi:hypothetical protein